MSLKPEPTVVCCNGVCNARILSIVSVPNLPCPGAGATEHAQWGGGCGDWPAEWGGGGTGWSTPDSSNIDWGAQGAGGGAEGGTADSSPQSGNTGHLDIEDEVESSEEEEETDRDLGKQNYLRMEPKSSPPQVRVFYIYKLEFTRIYPRPLCGSGQRTVPSTFTTAQTTSESRRTRTNSATQRLY